TSSRKLFPRPLSPVSRFRRGASSSSMVGAGPTFSRRRYSSIGLAPAAWHVERPPCNADAGEFVPWSGLLRRRVELGAEREGAGVVRLELEGLVDSSVGLGEVAGGGGHGGELDEAVGVVGGEADDLGQLAARGGEIAAVGEDVAELEVRQQEV